jgi:hypothetical protein
VFSGALDPGNVVIVREIRNGNGVGTDQAMFSDVRAAYECTDLSGRTPQLLTECPLTWDGGRLQVRHLATLVTDGTDIVENVETLVFSDSIAPETPSDVHADPGNGSAHVTFVPPVSIVNSYNVQVLDDAGFQVGPLRQITNPDIASILVTGLTNEQSYRFRVQGVNGFGPGPWSQPSNSVTPRAVAPNRLALPTVDPGDTQVRLTWSAPTDNGGSPVTGYDVRVKNLAGNVVQTLHSNDRVQNVTGLENGREYFFAVRAVNAQGNGAWSIENNATPFGRPGAPDLTGVDPRNHGALVRWTRPADDGGSDITGYRVQVRNLAGKQVGLLRRADGFVRRLLVRGLTNGTTYTFRVQAVSSGGTSAWSASMKAKPHN